MKTRILAILLGSCALPLSACGPAGPPDGAAAAAAPAGPRGFPLEAALKAGVGVATAGPGVIRETVTLYGEIEPDPAHVREIVARYPGVIRSVARDVGDRVAAGEVLATVESNESLQVYPVASPIAGAVTARHGRPGELAGADALFTVADFSVVRARFSVFPRDRGRLAAGQAVRVSAADETVTADARLSLVAPVGEPGGQMVIARAPLANAGGRWVSGQFVAGEVVVGETTAAVVVPASALQRAAGQAVVFIVAGESLRTQPVRVGRRSADAIEIVEGLQARQRYVSTNSFVVKAELLKTEE